MDNLLTAKARNLLNPRNDLCFGWDRMFFACAATNISIILHVQIKA